MTAPRNWTAPQQQAIDHDDGDLLVSAAAGSGKTAVLAERCARLVCEGRCGVENLLVLTFTDAAANEMKSRIAAALSEKLRQKRPAEDAARLRRQAALVDRASISTLHAFCSRVLRQHFAAAAIDPAFEVMDEEEARLLRDETAAEVIARWHQTPRPGCDFPAFFEAYAQGNDGELAAMVLRLHHMLASIADPSHYLAESRRFHADGAAGRVDHWAKTIVAGQVRVERLRASRAASEAARRLGPGQIASEVQRAAELLQWAENEITSKGCPAIAAARDALAYKWPTCKTLKDIPHFEAVKEVTWEAIKKRMSKLCKETLTVDTSTLAADLRRLAPSLDTLLALADDFAAAYTRAKRSAAAARLDFADLERLTHSLLTGDTDGGRLAAAELRARYAFLLVDEFQDINPLQAALLDAVNPAAAAADSPSADRPPPRGGLFVVGDVKQSIYGFRLAEPALFLARERAARSAKNRHVALPHNFRSRAALLQVMNGLFERVLTADVAGIAYDDGHALLPAPHDEAAPPDRALLTGAPVEIRLVATAADPDDDPHDAPEDSPAENLSAVEEEARLVARRIESLLDENRTIRLKDGATRPLMRKDIAILLRAMKNKAMIFARALARRGIPAHADLSTGYFDTTEVREVLALLHVIDNPRQDIPLATALLGPFGRFSHDDLALLRLTYDRDRVSFAEAAARYPIDADGTGVDHALNRPPPSPDLAIRLDAFWKQIAAWRDLLRTSPLHEGLAEIYADSKILPYVSGLEAGPQRVANLQALHQRALKFASFRKQGLHRFLRFIERLRDGDGDFGEAPVLSEASDVVRILSIHKSKGLEFPVVIAAGLGSKLRLHDAGPVLVHRDLGVGLSIADLPRNIYYPSATVLCIRDAAKRAAVAEELRLLYVALTRARDHLILTGHVKDEPELRKLKDACAHHHGALPEDLLLNAGRPVAWLLAALGCTPLDIQWPWQAQRPDAQIQITLEPPESARTTRDQPPATSDFLQRLLAARPLADVPLPLEGDVARALRRVTGQYAHSDMTTRPAVITVSALKSQRSFDGGDENPPGIPAPHLAPALLLPAHAARSRGTATHRVLQLLDFATIDRPALVADAIAKLVDAKKLAPEDAAIADADGIAWILETDPGKRLITAAKRIKALDRSLKLKRELPFTWTGPASPEDAALPPADRPTIRGTIDVLLADTKNKTAEILDYKTDSDFTWQAHLPAHETQMRYYLAAASALLAFPVTHATLLFPGPRQIHVVALTPSPAPR